MRQLFFSFIILFSFPAVLVFASSQEESDFLLNEGVKFFEMDKFEEAISFFDKVLEIEPNHVEALAKKGDALVNLGKFEQAVQYFDKLFTIAPYHSDEEGRFYIDKLIELEPTHVEALYKRGKSLAIFSNLLDKAISYFDRALEIEPNRPDIMSSKGEALLSSDKFEEAISYFDRALEIDPGNLNAIRGKGQALAELNEFEEAHSYLDRALEAQPNDDETLIRKGDAFRIEGNYDQAYQYLHKALEVNPENFLAINKFKVIHSLMNFTKLDGFAETIVHDSQGNLVAHLRVNEIMYLNHEIMENMINEWNVTKIINRNGTDYEVRQYEIVNDQGFKTVHGGVSSYGLKLHDVMLLIADYWFYLVGEGDTVRSVVTVFTPVV